MSFFSANVIFFDAEFSSLDPTEGKIISLALIDREGKELYLELDYAPEDLDEWVRENILPRMLGLSQVSVPEAAEKIREFAGKGKPHLVAYVNQFDVVFLHKLFAEKEWPFHWLSLDLASMMFCLKRDPERELDLAKELGLKTRGYNLHNALDDARLLRETYLALEKRAS